MRAEPLGQCVLSFAEECAAMRTAALTQSSFPVAATAWLETRKLYISPRTYVDYGNHIKTLCKFFSELPLLAIDADHVRAYQKMRMVHAGASIINREVSVLQQMLKRIGRWPDIGPQYQPLPLPKESPHRALSLIEEERLYRLGATNPNWEVAYCSYVISINTTAGPKEIRYIRLGDIDTERRTIHVQANEAKNEHRSRVIPLNESAWRAVEYLLSRAKDLGAADPLHYLLPFRMRKGLYDVTRPTMGWRTALRKMLKTAGVECSAYTFRHHAITKLLENPDVSENTAEDIAGHISPRMKKRYSHTRIEVKRAAVEALQRIGPRSVQSVEKVGKTAHK